MAHNRRYQHHREEQQRQQHRVAAAGGAVAAPRTPEEDLHFKVHYGPAWDSPRRRSPSPRPAAGAGAAAARRPRSPSPAPPAAPRGEAPASPRRHLSPRVSERQAEALARFKAARSRSPSPDRSRGASPRTPPSPSMERVDAVLNLRAARRAHDAAGLGAGAGPVVGAGPVPGMDRVRRPARHGAMSGAAAAMTGDVNARRAVEGAGAAGSRPLTPQKRDGDVAGGFSKKFRC
jgi:hypothetical protein